MIHSRALSVVCWVIHCNLIDLLPPTWCFFFLSHSTLPVSSIAAWNILHLCIVERCSAQGSVGSVCLLQSQGPLRAWDDFVVIAYMKPPYPKLPVFVQSFCGFGIREAMHERAHSCSSIPAPHVFPRPLSFPWGEGVSPYQPQNFAAG